MVRVIVIDDDVDLVDVFCEYLEMKNVTVVGRGYDGFDAVKLYEKLRPDVVLLDIVMPNYDGYYALDNIKKIDPDAKVIMITANLMYDKERILKFKTSSVISKPYDMNSVIEVIHRVHESSRDSTMNTINAIFRSSL